MLKIGDFSKMAQVSVKTLRYYDELGLLRPAWVDRYTGYRYYELQQLPRLNRILALRDLGFSLVDIDRLLRDDLPPAELQRLMQIRHVELAKQVQTEQARLDRVAARLKQIQQEGRLPRYEVLVKRVEPRWVAGIHDTIAERDDMDELFAELRSYLSERGAAAEGPGIAVYYDAEYSDTEYRDQSADIEAALPVARNVRGKGRIVVHELPLLDAAASVVYTGSYSAIGSAYSALMAWSQTGGYRIAGPNREVYLQGFEPNADPATRVTELLFPVEKITAPLTGEKGKDRMEPTIVNKPAFTVVGLPFKGLVSSAPYEDGQGNNEIGALWDQFNRRAGEIKDVSGPAYGLCFGMPNKDEPWYLAGLEVSGEGQAPEGMMRITVPPQKYAVFPCTLGTLGATYRYITEEWQPRTSHEHAEAPDFELYDEEFDPKSDPQNGKMYVYWPIK
jgi:predicted transcriptional regulator YdeE/DNA-binding transcriptional MerR regulator